MTRVLSSACIVLLSLVLGGRAWAGGKPQIAILGLEVYDNGSGIDPETTRAARDLTAALRARAKAGTGPYEPARGGEKELIDEKLLNNCDSEAAPCMATIGTELQADVLMYGKIEKSALNGQPVYKVSLKVLNVSKKQMTSSIVETLPIADAQGDRTLPHARAWYGKLAGATSGGIVLVKSNVERALVMIDEDVKGYMTNGTLSIPGVADGRHTLVIEAKDYQRYETPITVRTGETLTHSATLLEMSKLAPLPQPHETISREGTVTQSKSNVWKPIFYGTTVLEAGAIGFTIYEWRQGVKNAGQIVDQRMFNSSDCSHKSSVQLTGASLTAFNNACSNYKLQLVGWGTVGVLGVAMVGSFVMAFVRDGGSSEAKTADGLHRKRRELVVTPVITPDGAGATLRFDW